MVNTGSKNFVNRGEDFSNQRGSEYINYYRTLSGFGWVSLPPPFPQTYIFEIGEAVSDPAFAPECW